MPQICFTSPPQSLIRRPASALVWMHVDVPQPSPDVVPLPPSPHPVPPAPPLPPEITDPMLPGQNVPVQEPFRPTPWSINGWLH